MSARWVRVSALAGVVGLASLARADAPPDQYGLFNLDSDTIEDLRTGLFWQRYPSPATYDWKSTFGACANVALTLHPSGWRVPSYKELMTIVDEAPHTEYEQGALVTKAIDPNAFPGTPVTSNYWTSSSFPGQPGSGYAIDFGTGLPQAQSKTQTLFVRCVHDPP